MAITVNKTPETYKFVPLAERGEENPFTATLRRLPPRQFTILEDKIAKINKDESISFTTGSFNWSVIKKGLVGWENLLDGECRPINPVKDSDGDISDDSLNLLPLDLISEIANTIVSISKDPDNAPIYLGDTDFTPANKKDCKINDGSSDDKDDDKKQEL